MGKLADNFSVSSGLQLRFSKYVIPMKERGLELKVFQVRSLACRLVQISGFTDKFNPEKKVIETAFRKSCVSAFNRNDIAAERAAPFTVSDRNQSENNHEGELILNTAACGPSTGGHWLAIHTVCPSADPETRPACGYSIVTCHTNSPSVRFWR